MWRASLTGDNDAKYSFLVGANTEEEARARAIMVVVDAGYEHRFNLDLKTLKVVKA